MALCKSRTDPPRPLRERHGSCSHSFLFATGIENSYPVIAGWDGRALRVDEMEKCGHYQRWREDFALVRALGLEYLRYGPPYYRTHTGPGHYDWSFADETLTELRRLGLVPILDLCHFGVPDWIGNFQNPDWPALFAAYAGAFAARYPWVRYYTLVNEIFVTDEHLVPAGSGPAQPSGEAYHKLVSQWRGILPVESHCLCPHCGSRPQSVPALHEG